MHRFSGISMFVGPEQQRQQVVTDHSIDNDSRYCSPLHFGDLRAYPSCDSLHIVHSSRQLSMRGGRLLHVGKLAHSQQV